jgi:hypothetical protein
MDKKKPKILEGLFAFLDFIKTKLQEFDKKNPYTSQVIQLSFIYFFALVDLVYSVLNNIFSLGYLSESIIPFYGLIAGILQSPIFKIWASPEKVFFMSYIVLEFMVIRSTLNFSKFIKYNILLVFALLMIQGLVISFWDLLFHREITDAVAMWAYDEGLLIATNKKLAIFFFLFTFIAFVLIYFHFYSNALKGKIVTLPGLHWVTDSVAFWLKIKTPTMRLGDKKKKDKNNDPD